MSPIINDIVKGDTKIIESNILNRALKIYNIGKNKTESLYNFIATIEELLNKKVVKQMLPIQAGDVPKKFADVNNLIKDYNYAPTFKIKQDISNFINWFKTYKNN